VCKMIFLANILVSKSKWFINLFLSLLFMKLKFERHLLYFTSLTITWSLIIKRRFHGCMAIGKHLISLRKYNYCTTNVLLNKGVINICFGPIFFSKKYWLIWKCSIMPKKIIKIKSNIALKIVYKSLEWCA